MKNWYYLSFLMPFLWASCSEEQDMVNSAERGSLSINPTVEMINLPQTRSGSDSIPDLNTFTFTLTDNNSKQTVVSGIYGEFPGGLITDIPVSSYTLTLSSHDEDFVPAFEEPRYQGIDNAVTITSDEVTTVTLECVQSNAGLSFVYDATLAEAGFTNLVPEVEQGEHTLVYEGANKDARGYFLPGNVSLKVKNGSSYIQIGGSIAQTLTLKSQEWWEVTLKTKMVAGDLQISATVKVITDPTNYEEFIVGDGEVDPYLPDPNAPKAIPGYFLAWHDEFNEEGLLNEEYWNYEEGFVRNEELQWYQPDNARMSNGVLTIEGRIEQVPNPDYKPGSSEWREKRQYAEYTSTSITTNEKVMFTYGRLEIRAKIPTASGSWPAMWTLGEGEWPNCGEVDILEYYMSTINGSYQPCILANYCWGSGTRWVGQWDSWKVPFTDFTSQDADWADKFHTWRLDWDENYGTLYIDDVLMRQFNLEGKNNAGLFGDYDNPFRKPHFLLLNLAIGNNGGTPDNSKFPLKYEIDYVRLYQKTGE